MELSFLQPMILIVWSNKSLNLFTPRVDPRRRQFVAHVFIPEGLFPLLQKPTRSGADLI